MKFLPLILGWDGTGNVYWHVDASFAVHHDMKSHTGAGASLGVGAVISNSRKQSCNTTSSTTAEVYGVSDSLPFIIWINNFLKDKNQAVNEVQNLLLRYKGSMEWKVRA